MPELIEKPEEVLKPKKKNIGGKKGVALLIVGIIILVIIIVFLVLTIFVSPIKGGAWYGVFLTNGRTYFGHIVKQNSQVVVLKDVYYLQVQQLAPTEEEQQPQSQLSLVNVADELHGPESEMQISRTHILYIQKLKEDSQVAMTIEQQLGI
ncbi:hypothetical protein ISS21_00015 [Patescibacteria group bacterium]|nr:hypothetical protein [Patescibacteria group bacterium]